MLLQHVAAAPSLDSRFPCPTVNAALVPLHRTAFLGGAIRWVLSFRYPPMLTNIAIWVASDHAQEGILADHLLPRRNRGRKPAKNEGDVFSLLKRYGKALPGAYHCHARPVRSFTRNEL